MGGPKIASKDQIMKKILILSILGGVLLAVGGCSKPPEGDPNPPKTDAAATTPAPENADANAKALSDAATKTGN